jgi:hypothetical protein
MKTLPPETRLKVAPDVVSRNLDGEQVILDLKTGVYYGLDEVGTFLWERFASGKTLAQARADLVAEFDVEAGRAAADLSRLVQTLKKRNLVVVS